MICFNGHLYVVERDFYRNPVRPAGKWAKGLTCQNTKTPACHVQFFIHCFLIFIYHFFFTVN